MTSATSGSLEAFTEVPPPALSSVLSPLSVDRLPGTAADDPYFRLALAFLAEYPANSARSYRADLRLWWNWCAHLGVHPFDAQRHHVSAWVRSLTTEVQGNGKTSTSATVARRLSALSAFYAYAITENVLASSPVANVRRPRVGTDSTTSALTAKELAAVLSAAQTHGLRSFALVSVLAYSGVRISEALGANVASLTVDGGHRVLRIVRKGGKTGTVVLPPAASEVLGAYVGERTTGPLFLAADGQSRYVYTSAVEQLKRLSKAAGIDDPKRISAHSFRHSFATESLGAGVPLQDVQDALGHADPRTTRRYDRARRDLSRSPGYAMAAVIAKASSEQ